MRDTVDAPAVIGAHRDDKAIVAQSNQFFLNRVTRLPHQVFQRTRDRRAQSRNLVTDAHQFRAGAIVDLAVREYLFVNRVGELL